MSDKEIGRTSKRKGDHLAVSLQEDVSSLVAPGWEDVYLLHKCLPEVDKQEINLSTDLLGRRLRYPIVISALTGGHEAALQINANLATAAEEFGIAMGVGSERAFLESAAWAASYAIARERAPTAFLIANVGAPQLISQRSGEAYTMDQIRSAISLIQADALAIHLNFLQEAVQPEGDVRARGCGAAIARVARDVAVPVIVKETGAGIVHEEATMLRSLGVAAIDVGGAGGTSMTMVESLRAPSGSRQASLGRLLAGWGTPTAVSIAEAGIARLPVIATGGIRNGLDAAKALALGATAVGIALPLLRVAAKDYPSTRAWLQGFIEELHTAMFLTGSTSVVELSRRVLVLGRVREWLVARGILRNGP